MSLVIYLKIRKNQLKINISELKMSSFLKEGDHEVVEDFLFCLRRATFVQSHKSGEKDSLKNFSVILSVYWFTRENGESLHPILLDSFSISMDGNSNKSDKWKFFRLFRAVFYIDIYNYNCFLFISINVSSSGTK